MNNYKEEILQIYSKYNELRTRLSSLEKVAQTLAEAQLQLHEEMDNTRKDELALINKIEDETGISITQEYLLEIINSNNG